MGVAQEREVAATHDELESGDAASAVTVTEGAFDEVGVPDSSVVFGREP